jgi:aspartyl protease family protein
MSLLPTLVAPPRRAARHRFATNHAVGRLGKAWAVFCCLPLFVLVIAGGANDWMVASAQDHAELLPRLGETADEFEARARGLVRPRPGEPVSATLQSDTQGHFYVEPTINGARVRMMVDTGSTLVVLSREDARWVGINPAQEEYTMPATTANGVVLLAPVVLEEVVVGEVAVRNVPAAVLPDNTLQVGLLGMSFLSKLSQFEVAGGRLVLKQ